MGEYQQRTIVQLRKDFKKSEAEVERLKALLRKDVVAINERDVAEGMEQAAVIAEGHGPGDTEACIAAVIRAKIK